MCIWIVERINCIIYSTEVPQGSVVGSEQAAKSERSATIEVEQDGAHGLT